MATFQEKFQNKLEDLTLMDKRTCTFVVTEDCNFRCKYCYMTGKGKGKRMPFEIAKKAIDYLISEKVIYTNTEMTWDFIGGEPMLELDLIEQIIEYIMQATYINNHPWFTNSYFGMSSNGSLYGEEKMQKLLLKYGSRFDVGLTIDGPDYVHDLERIYVNGSGTHSDVVKNIPKWLERKQNPSTKVTVSHNNLPYIKDMVLYIYSLGISTIHINVVFEDVWEEGDDLLLEQQLDSLGDALIEQDLYKTHECSFFAEHIGKPIDKREDNNWCGAGKYMIAVDYKGNFYPCVRFLGFSLTKQPPIIIGNVFDGIDYETLSPFFDLTRSGQSTEECMNCEVASGCAWCQGHCYDSSPNGTINHRATYICKMHKARVRANERFWAKVNKLK